MTFHDSCNIARSGDLVEEPREVLRRVCADFREMYPNRRENFCCTGGGGLLSMAEYRPLRLEVGEDQGRTAPGDRGQARLHDVPQLR